MMDVLTAPARFVVSDGGLLAALDDFQDALVIDERMVGIKQLVILGEIIPGLVDLALVFTVG
jgi:hypothetical protein